ncbi:MAG: isocitrate/isopropylmalate dehydrogenase family protein [Methanomicrobiales archaeon]|nr:isocitrate/isopropylmalate dehydrogenase family protein [Methanomicrobiales archaeon]MDI6875883.1 isocitrate/isopropylmalate dehydrogenase family protein [Methanomicrobiales archaeon]
MPVIAVVEGDGIGREVVPVAQELLGLLRPDFEFVPVEVGYGLWKRTGSAIAEDAIDQLRAVDAVLFGAVTTPADPDYRSVVVRIRKELDLYANIRPVAGKGFDVVIVRENTEGLYAGIERIEPDRACTVRLITRRGSERIARAACRLAGGRRHLTVGHKANVLKSDLLFRDVCRAEAEAAGIPCRERFIDALCLDLLLHPGDYDVIVTENMFGDILSDVAAFLVGGLGMLPSANIGDRHALFEPVHGSAPDIAGKDVANPVAAIRSGAMLLRHLGDEDSALRLEGAVESVFGRGIRTRDLGGTAGTREFGRAVYRELERHSDEMTDARDDFPVL